MFSQLIATGKDIAEEEERGKKEGERKRQNGRENVRGRERQRELRRENVRGRERQRELRERGEEEERVDVGTERGVETIERVKAEREGDGRDAKNIISGVETIVYRGIKKFDQCRS